LWWQFDEYVKGKRVIVMATGNYNTPLEGQSVQIIRGVILPSVLN
jgi:hypothetical protein